jgi:tetratricopeptide (TPR) repeat protein
VYANRGEYDLVLESLQQQLGICEELGLRSEISTTIANLGVVHARRGELDRALECFQRQLGIDEELGNRSGIATAITNIANVYSDRGEFDRALESFQRTLSISEELCDRSGIVTATCNMGNVYTSRGEYDRALESYHRAAEVGLTIGSQYERSKWLRGIALVLVELHQTGGAMPEYLPKYLRDVFEDHWQAVALQQARANVEECLTIGELLSQPNMQFVSRVLMARIEAADGNVGLAVDNVKAMLAEATDEPQLAELHYWLWKFGEPGYSKTAHTMYEALVAGTPQYEYKQRLEELTAAASYEETGNAPE